VSVDFESRTFETPSDLFSIKTEDLSVRDNQDPASVPTQSIRRPCPATGENIAADDDVICSSIPGDLDRDKNSIHPIAISKQKSREAQARGRIDNICAGEATWKCTAPANSQQPSSPRLSLETEVPPTVSMVNNIQALIPDLQLLSPLSQAKLE